MANAFNPLPSLIRASAQDAGNSNMRKNGRTKWSDDDWNVMCETQDRLIRSKMPDVHARIEEALT